MLLKQNIKSNNFNRRNNIYFLIICFCSIVSAFYLFILILFKYILYLKILCLTVIWAIITLSSENYKLPRIIISGYCIKSDCPFGLPMFRELNIRNVQFDPFFNYHQPARMNAHNKSIGQSSKNFTSISAHRIKFSQEFCSSYVNSFINFNFNNV